ncbi:MAG: outer membrane protein transport protein [Pseudomonadota bacterium]
MAGGFYAPYQSGTANATALAGATAGTGDASGLFFNPAANADFDQYEVFIDLKAFFPEVRLDAFTSTAGGAPVGGNTRTRSLASDAFAPNIYISVPVWENVNFGFAVTSPYAAKLDASDTWAGRHHVINTDVTTINANASLAWQATDWLAVGAGLAVQYFDGEFERREYLPTFATMGTPFVGDIGTGFLEGDDIEIGFTAGLVLTPMDGTRIGIAYRSAFEHDFSGRAGNTGNPVFMAPAAATTAQYDLTMPQIVSLGLHQVLTDRLTFLAEAQWIDFSTFTGFDITLGTFPFRDVRPQDWDDSYILAAGFSYQHDELTKLSAGIHYDTGVSSGGGNTLSPDADRIMIGFGVEREISENITLSAHYAHVFFDNAPISVDDPTQGVLVGQLVSGLDMGGIALQIRW